MSVIIIGLCLLATCVHGAPAVNKTDSATKELTPSVQSNSHPANDLSRESAQKVIIARKREIPDALVDHPEDFDEVEEENNRDDRDSEYKSIPVVDDSVSLGVSPLDEDANEYPYYGSVDGRGKRTAAVLLGRAKRGLEVDPAQLMWLFGKNRNYNIPQRHPNDWSSESMSDYDSSDSNNVEDSSEYFGPLQGEGWSGNVRNRVYPIRRISVPVYGANIF